MSVSVCICAMKKDMCMVLVSALGENNNSSYDSNTLVDSCISAMSDELFSSIEA